MCNQDQKQNGNKHKITRRTFDPLGVLHRDNSDARAGEQHLILKKQIEGDQNPKEIHYHKPFD